MIDAVARNRVLSRERMRRYRLRKMGKPDGTLRACVTCGARLSRYTPITDHLCWTCSAGRGEVCKRGHDLETHARVTTRGTRTTITCAECKRHRDAGYARMRRAREAA